MASILLQHLKDLLSNYFTDFNDESLDVNLLSGQAALTNLNFRKVSVSLLPNLQLRLEKGFIESLRLFYRPQLRTFGSLELQLQSLDLVFRLSYETEDEVQKQETSSANREREIFLKQLRAHKWRSSIRRAWVVEKVKDYLVSCLGRILIDSTMIIKNVSVAVIIPVSREDASCIKFTLDSITIDNKASRKALSANMHFINKEICVRNLAARMCKAVPLGKIQYSLDIGDFNQFFTIVPFNPISINATISGLATLSPLPQLDRLDIIVHISELQLSLQQLTLELLHRCLGFHELQSHLRQLKALAFGESYPVSKARKYWKFCLYAALYNIYGGKFLSRIRLRHSRYDLRRKVYARLYLQTVLYELKALKERFETLTMKFDEVAIAGTSVEFQRQRQELEALTMQLSTDSIAFERSRIDDLLLQHGLDKKTLFQVLVKQREFLSEYRSASFEENTVHFINKISIHCDVDGMSVFIDQIDCAPCIATKTSRSGLKGSLFEGLRSPEIRLSDPSSCQNFLVISLQRSNIRVQQESGHVACNAVIGTLSALSEEGQILVIDSSRERNEFAIKSSFDYYQLDPNASETNSKKPFFYQNLKREASIGFLKPTTSHIVGDLIISSTEVKLYSRFLNYSSKVVSLVSKLSNSTAPHFFSKLQLAEIAQTRQWMEFLEPVKVSVMACLRGLSVSLPAIEDKKIRFQAGPTLICSGDYRSYHLQHVNLSPLSSLLESFSQISDKFQPFLSPLHLSLSLLFQNIELCFVEESLECSSEMIIPFNILAQYHFAALPTNLDFCGTCVGLVMDSISLTLHPKVMSYLLKFVASFPSTDSREGASAVHPLVLPRVRNLARVSKSLAVLAIRDVRLDLVDDSAVAFSRIEVVYRLLYLFANRLESLREDVVNYLIFFNQIRNRLVNFGVPLTLADSLLRDLAHDEDFGQHNSLTADNLAQKYSQALIQQRVNRLDEEIVQSEVIVGLKCRAVEFSSESLTFDFSLLLQLETCEMYNCDGSSLLKLSSTSREICIETEEEETLEDEAHAELKDSGPHSATVSLVSKSELYPFGEGGYSSRVLYGRHVIEEFRNEIWRIDLSLLSVEFDAVSIIQIFRKLSSIQSSLFPPTATTQPILSRQSIADSKSTKFEKSPTVTVLVNHDLVCRTESAQLLFSSHTENFCLVEIKRLQGVFSHYRENDLRVRLDCLRLFDLSVAGRLYRDILWVKRSAPSTESRNTKHAVSVVIMNKYVNGCNLTSAVVSISGLRLCFLYRFVLQLIDFIHRQIVLSFSSETECVSSPVTNTEITSTDDTTVSSKFELILLVSDLSAIVPRNSSSFDLIGLTVDQAVVQFLPVEEAWSSPTEEAMTQSLEASSDSVLAFNPVLNKWERVTRDDTAIFPEYLEELFAIMGFIGADDIFSQSDVFYHDLQSLLFEKRQASTVDGSVTRTAVFAREAHIFTALGTEEVEPLNWSRRDHLNLNNSSRMPLFGPLFSKISLGAPVKGVTNRYWFRSTRDSINLDVIVDFSADVLKLLFSDTVNSKPLNVAVTQAELYLLLGFWFDNFHETVEFLNPMEENSNDTVKMLRRESSVLLSSIPRYGGDDYFSYFMRRKISFELVVVQSTVSLSMALDKGMFERDIPSVDYLTAYQAFNRGVLARTHPLFSLPDGDWRGVVDENREVIPIGQVVVEGLIVQVMADHDVSLVGVTGGSAKVLEGRLPAPSSLQNLSLQQVLLELSSLSHPNSINYGLITFDTFFDTREGSNILGSCQRSPLSIGIAMSSYLNWMNVNIFLDHPDLILSNLDVCFLLSEYFSCYFRFEEFGSPSLAAFYRLDPSVIPYGGTDVRLVLRKPHISLVHDGEGGRSNLFLEAEKGASYRYFYDTSGAVKTFYDIQSLSLVLLKDFDRSIRYRGVRGSSGFGSGKSLIEYFNCSLFQFYDTSENRQDMKLEVFSMDEQTFAEIVNFRSRDEIGGLDIVFPEINYLNSLHSLSKNFPRDSCDMVISFEDVVMVLTIFYSCLSAPPASEFSEVQVVLENRSEEAIGSEVMTESESAKQRSYWESFSFFNFFAHFVGIRILLIDNTLGMHLPFFQVFLQDIAFVTDLHQHVHKPLSDPSLQDLRKSLKQGANRNSISVVSKGFLAISSENDGTSDAQPLALHDVSCYGEVVAWVESFNNLKKCWEPFVEPFACHILVEKTRSHGTGLILRVDTPFHFNLSGAIIHTIFDSIRNYQVFRILEGKGGEGVAPKQIKVEEFEDRMSNDVKSQASENCQIEFYSAKNPRERAFSLTNTNSAHVLTATHVDHFRALPLHPSVRVGFSLLNLTGQSLRYLQQWEGGKLTVQYLGDGERGLLNFVPSQTLMRNMKVVEEAFDVQQGRSEFARSKMRKKLVGNRLALQICGYRWIKSIEADELGVQYRHLSPVLGRADPTAVFSENQRIKNVLKLMVEIVPFNQGRMMILRSVFSVRNECGHSIRILTKTENLSNNSIRSSVAEVDSFREESVESVFELKSKESLYLPISLLSKSIFATNGSSLGQLYLQPVDSSSVRDELIARLNISPGIINYSTDPINLFHLAYREKKVATELESSSKIDRDFLYISCHINPEEKSRKMQRQNIRKSLETDHFLAEREHAAIFRLPPFCYSIEILHNTTINGRAVSDRGGRRDRPRSALRIDEPKNFTLVIHPPITIENLLPCSAGFEIVHATEKRELWSAQLGPARSQSVHTVSMEEPLMLLVHLSYCRASEGILIHQPRNQVNERGGFTNALQRTLEGILEENESETTVTITLYDSLGQTLRLNVENVEGLGGQRHITVSCPFWVVNTSQFTFQIREEGEEDLTAGSSRTERYGKTSPMSPISTRLPVSRIRSEASGKQGGNEGDERLWSVFPGTCGPLHSSYHREISLDSPISNLFNDLSFTQVSALAFLFNFQEEGSLLRSKGSVKVQLDGSDWSKSVSLLGVGVNQGLTVDHNEHGMLEIGLKIKSAPGRLARFTKIVRFTPRFIVVNRMNAVLKVCQVGNFQEEDSVEVEVSPQHARPYHLPSLFGARKICLQVEGPWEKSVSFDIDQIGIFTVLMKKKVDLANIRHVNTRGAAEYSVELPPNRMIGIGFETDWGEENIVIKSVQSGGFGAKETDVRVGDVLLEVDGQRVSGARFEDAMTMIKSQLQRNVCVLKLRTVEEKLRLMRESAFQQIQRKEQDRRRAKSTHSSMSSLNTSNAEMEGKDGLAVRVELRQVESSIVILASELDTTKMQEYRIENQSVAYRLYFKQKGMAGSSWTCINPGQSSPYIFEDPSKPHKILMHVGENVLCPSDFRNSSRFADNGEIGEKGKGDDSLGSYLSYLSGIKTETATVMNLDEIGFSEELPLPRAEGHLIARIRSEGPTKVLVISPSRWKLELLRELDFATEFIFEQLSSIKEFAGQVESIRSALLDVLSGRNIDSNVPTAIGIIYKEYLSSLRVFQDGLVGRIAKSISAREIAASLPSQDPSAASSKGIDLKSFVPFQRLYDAGIETHHQVLVEVLEAKEITPFVMGKAEDIYCQLYVRNRERSGFIDRSLQKSQFTYVCDQTFEPQWLNQRFVFDIPPDAPEEVRNYSLRVLVKAKSLSGLDSVISKVDIPLSCLKNEEEVEGWFSLRQQINNSVIGLRTSGSIRLRLQWIHSEYGFSGYVLEQSNRRARELLLFHNVLQFTASQLKKSLLSPESKVLAVEREIELLSEDARNYYYRIQMMAKERDAARLKIPQSQERENLPDNNHTSSRPPVHDESRSPRPRSPRKVTIFSEQKDAESVGNHSETRFVGFSRRINSSSSYDLSEDHNHSLSQRYDSQLASAHDRVYFRWLENLTHFTALHKKFSKALDRDSKFEEDSNSFLSRFQLESSRSFHHVYTSSCALEIKPIKVESLLIKNTYVHAKISYGDKTFRTRSIPSSHYMSWSEALEDEHLSGKIHHSPDRRKLTRSPSSSDIDHEGSQRRDDSSSEIPAGEEDDDEEEEEEWIKAKFDVDLLNIKGSIKIRLIAETFPSFQEIARVEIPVFGLIDSTCIIPENDFFVKTFPLTLSDGSRTDVLTPATDRLSDKNYPRISLALKLVDKKDVHGLEGRKRYGRIQVPSFSFSCIDSQHSRDVMLITLLSLELKLAAARESMNLSVILSSLQVDNQLTETLSSVILFPTPVKSPQPVIRAHIKKKNLLSQHNLDCYETVQFVIQELELKLEQQLVLASWEMVKSWTKEIFPDHRFEHREMIAGSHAESLTRGGTGPVKKNFSPVMTKDFLHWKRQQDDSNSFSFAVAQLEKSYDIKKLIDDEDVAKLYIDDFKIFPIKINVSFLINPTYVIRKYRKERREDLANDGASAGLYSALSILLWQVGSVVLDLTSSISDAPIFFNGFEAPHLFKSQEDVTQILQEHYFHRALGQLYKIVFSSEVVGNPIALLNSLSVGVHDFFYEPAHALITTPTEISKIGKGFVKGAASLVSNSTAGLIGTASTITRSVGRGVLKLSTDKSFLKAREKLQQHPRNVREAFIRPWKDVGNGFYYGFRGLVTVPYRSTKKKGLRGVVPGLAKGVIGLGADPLVGILDAVAHCGDAAREVAKKVNKQPEKVVERMRLATVFGVDGRILPYNYNVSFGTQILNAMARPMGDGENQNFLTATLMQGNQFVHDVLGGSEEVFSLEKNRRLSFSHGNAQHRSSSHYSPMQQQGTGFYETFTNPLTGSGSVEVVDDYDNSSDDSMLASPDREQHHSPRNANYSSHYDDDESEYVVHTAIIRRKVEKTEFDVVAVLSSKRLMIFEHHKRGQSTYLKKKWEGSLKQLAAPTIVSSEGDAALTLQLTLLDDRAQNNGRRRSLLNLFHGSPSGGNSEVSQQPTSSKGNNVFLKGTYQGDHIILNLYNCINTLLGHFTEMQAMELSALSACREDELGIRHVGPWQFSRSVSQARTFRKNGQLRLIYRDEEDAQLLYQENKRIINKLKYHSWECVDDNISCLDPDISKGYPSSEVLDLSAASPRASVSSSYSPPPNSSGSKSEGADHRPQWLILEERQSIVDQNLLKRIHEECRLLEQDLLHLSQPSRDSIRELLRDFHSRKITRRTFFQKVNFVKQLDQGEEDNQSLTSAATNEKKPKKAILRSAINFIGALSRRSTQRFTKADLKDAVDDKDASTVELSPPPLKTESEEVSVSASNPSNAVIEGQRSEEEQQEESVGKHLLTEGESAAEKIETVIPFSKRHISKRITRPASPSRSSPPPKSSSLKGGDINDSDDRIRIEHKPSWLSRLFNDHSFAADETLRSSPEIGADRNEKDNDNLSTQTKSSHSQIVVDGEEPKEETGGEIFDIFPNYDRFDADFDESGNLHERRFSESQGSQRLRLNSEDVARGFNNDFSTFSFEQIKSPVSSFRGSRRASEKSRVVSDGESDEPISPSSPLRLRKQAQTELHKPYGSPTSFTPTPRTMGPPYTERTLESQDDSRFASLQLDRVTERLNRIEDLLVAVLAQSNALPSGSSVEDFIRPQLHDLSQELREGPWNQLLPPSSLTPSASVTLLDRESPETMQRRLPSSLRSEQKTPSATIPVVEEPRTPRQVPEEEIPLKREEGLGPSQAPDLSSLETATHSSSPREEEKEAEVPAVLRITESENLIDSRSGNSEEARTSPVQQHVEEGVGDEEEEEGKADSSEK